MGNLKFNITIRSRGRFFKPEVEVTYSTNQLLRFTVRGGNKEMYLRKDLTKKRLSHQWKIEGFSYDYTADSDTSQAILDIMLEIDRELGL